MRHPILLLYLLLCSSSFLPAQQNNFINYTAKDGLRVTTILALEQDSRNYLWIGTYGGGLCRFDGKRFQTYTTNNGLAGNEIRAILEDSRGDLWIGTDGGISVYNGHSFTTLKEELGITSSAVMALYEDRDGWIWAATNYEGLRRIRIENDSVRVRAYSTENGLGNDFVLEVLEDVRGRFWIATATGLDVMTPDQDTFSIYHFGDRASLNRIRTTSLLEDSEGSLWAGTRYSGLLKFPASDDLDAIEPEIFDSSNGLSDNQVWDILEDVSGNLWIATDEGGVNLLTEDGFTAITKDQGLLSNQAFRLLEDREQNIWIGTYGSGLSKFFGKAFTNFDINEKPGPSNVSCIVEDPSENYWIGTYGDGLIRMQLREGLPVYQHFSRENGLAENDITDVTLDQNNNIWFSYATSGIGRLSPSGMDQYTSEQGEIISNSVMCLTVDSRNRLWCGTNGGITILQEGAPPLFLDESMGLSSNFIQTIMEDSRGSIWIGSLNGLMQVKNLPAQITEGDLEMIRYDEKEGLTELKILALAEDEEGDIWIGSFGAGIFRLRRSAPDSLMILPVVSEDPLSSNIIYSLIFENDSTLLAGTEKGLDKILLDEEKQVKYVKRYNESHGFIGIENNQNASYRDPSGQFWFGTTSFLTRFDPCEEPVNMEPLHADITGIRVRYEESDWNSIRDDVVPWFNLPAALKLNWKQNHITLQFIGVSLSNPENIRYRYRLLGLDNEWSPPTGQNEVIYQSLDPGHYEFQVVAENADGIWNREPTSYQFIISPPFWQNWWFYTLTILCIVLLVFLLIRSRERRLVRKNRLLETKVRERTREIREQKEEIESQRDEIEAQRDEIEKQRDVVLQQKQSITDSINYAERLQYAILPHGEQMHSCLPEHFIIFKPRDIVSGDFYWIKEMKDYLILVVADCTGHGVPGAFMSMLGITLLNEQVAKSRFDKPADILDRLRRKVKDMLAQEGRLEEQKDGMDMAIAIYNRDNAELQYAGAYNPLYVIRRKGDSKEDPLQSYSAMENRDYVLYELKGDRQPIGIHSMETGFTNHRIDLQKQDALYIFSDGFLDQFGGPHRKKFKAVNFKKLLLSLQDMSMDEQKEQIEEAYENWKGHGEQIDDICIVGLKI